jgi:endonuclease YncB( thermonuclease family)
MKAIVKRIVDGDTIILDIQMGVIAIPTDPSAAQNLIGMGFYIDPHGMLVMAKVRARLYDFYAAESDTPEGIAAKTRLELALPVGTEVLLELHGRDKYGRLLVVPVVGRTAADAGTNICLSLSKANGKPKGRGVKAQGVPKREKAAPHK